MLQVLICNQNHLANHHHDNKSNIYVPSSRLYKTSISSSYMHIYCIFMQPCVFHLKQMDEQIVGHGRLDERCLATMNVMTARKEVGFQIQGSCTLDINTQIVI